MADDEIPVETESVIDQEEFAGLEAELGPLLG